MESGFLMSRCISGEGKILIREFARANLLREGDNPAGLYKKKTKGNDEIAGAKSSV